MSIARQLASRWRQLDSSTARRPLATARARQAHGDVAVQHCAVQLPQCSMVALRILEGMGGRGGGPCEEP